MLVFIDDSGDPGFKIEKGSTQYFVISMVIFDDNLEAEKTAIAIKELKRKIHFSENTEFRFFKTSSINKKKFLNVVNSFKFRIRCLVVDKSLIKSRELNKIKILFIHILLKRF